MYAVQSVSHLPRALYVFSTLLRPSILLRLSSLLMLHPTNTPSLRTQSPLRSHTRPNLRKCRPRLPAHTLPRGLYIVVQLIDLFEGKALRLVNHEVHECDAQEAAREPDEEDLGLQVGVARAIVYEVGCRVSDRPV